MLVLKARAGNFLPECRQMSSVPSCRCSSFWEGEGRACEQVGGRSC